MKRILVVDDEPKLRATIREFLEEQAYSVQDAGSGVEGLAAFEKHPPDLVVSDVLMPAMDGFQFCRRLRETRLGQLIPFIFLSSKGEVEDRIKGHKIGADDYLVKPFEPKELIAKIEAQLERSRRIHSEIIRLLMQSPVRLDEAAAPPPKPSPEPLPLTPAEEIIFWEVIQGFSNKEIGERQFLSPRTVQAHLTQILRKLELTSRSQLIRFAFERGYKAPAHVN